MKPGKSKINLFSPIVVEFGVPITFKDWILSPEGYNLSEEEISSMLQPEPAESQEMMGDIYREFTDQLMGTLEDMGAPNHILQKLSTS